MRKCKVETTIPRGKHWFTEEESAWVLSFFDKFSALPTGRSGPATKKHEDFYHDLAKRFCKKFPYRDPENNQNWSYSEPQKKLAMTNDDRAKLQPRLGDKLRHHRRGLGKSAPPASSTRSPNTSVKSGAGQSVPSPPQTQSDDEDWADMPPEPGPSGEQDVESHQVRGDDAESGSSGPLSDPQGLGPRYETSEQDQVDMELALLDLQATTRESWAAIGDEELRQRQNSIVVALWSVLKVFERGTGAELHAMALWHNGEGMQMCRYGTPAKLISVLVKRRLASCSTDRLSGFDETPGAELSWSTFIQYAQQRLGPAMSTSVTTASPTVYGDPDNHMRLALPLMSSSWEMERSTMRLFFEYLWVWQGGLLPVPWSRLPDDGRQMTFYLVEQWRLPEGISYLEDPYEWGEQQTLRWSIALRKSDTPLESIFQFRQPRPGLVETKTRQVMHPDSQLTYRPESLLYMRRRMMEQAAYTEEWQGLPPILTQLYRPLVPEQQDEIEAAAQSLPALLELVKFMEGYEAFGLYQATRNDWERAVERCCHLRSEVPSVTAGLEHFVHTVDENGAQFLRQFFDLSGPKSYLWDLGVCSAWIDEGAMMHRSGSYMAGPYGFKWLVLLLVHFHSCGSKINAHLGPAYEGITPEWSRKDAALVQVMVEQVQLRLNQSILVLLETQDQRRQEAPNTVHPAAGMLHWTEADVIHAVLEESEDEWTRLGQIVTSGLEGDEVGSKAAGRPVESKKRSRKHLRSDDNPVEDDDSEADSERKSFKKKSKSNSSGVDPDEYDGFTRKKREYIVFQIVLLQYELPVDWQAHRQNAPEELEQRSQFGQLQNLFSLELPPKTLLNRHSSPRHLLLALILEANVTQEKPFQYEVMWYGDGLSTGEVVDANASQRVVGHIQDGKRWWIVD
ncbi:hypothetical protein FRC06_004712 [Ceratobasidium sp. 370]|nr:hypothetical protein FRC06_004712 [Ceratobasidium sp. 370]